MAFDGYSDESIGFLAALPSRDPDWFKANKKEYERLIVAPTKALVVDLGERLREFVPDIVAEPKTNGSIAPINNDLRFSPDKPPYKDNLMLRLWEGAPKKTAPTLFVRIAPDGVGFATGVIPADLDRWRSAVAGEGGAELADAIAATVKKTKAEVVGQELKRVPAPFDADHPRGDLLRHKMLQVRWIKPLPKSVAKASFAGWCAGQLEEALPIHRWLVENL